MRGWKASRILAEPATVEACQADRGTRKDRSVAASAARDQLAFTRQSAADTAAAKAAGRRSS
ncbi:hypothetical protein ACFW91_25040 [Streptomyces asoensis]|uniref:hypothetical protein n=1 Tax=Streptomyces asoensis TaxID=249586 RepID=UPI0036C092C7